MTNSLLAIALILTTGAAAAAYPDKPITMVVAYSPGGGTDLIARHIQPFLEKYLGGGARIVIVHRPGAGGEIGFAAIANAPADGYTIDFVNAPPLITVPIERTAQFGGPQFLGACRFRDQEPEGARRLRESESRQGHRGLERHRIG